LKNAIDDEYFTDLIEKEVKNNISQATKFMVEKIEDAYPEIT